MRIEELKIYRFEELSVESQKRAIQDYRCIIEDDPYIPWQREIFDSLKAVYETANIKLLDYSLGLDTYRQYVRIDLDSSVGDLTGSRALAWIENNLLSKLRISRSEYLKNRKNYIKYRYKIGAIKDCPFTGVCFDMDFLDCITQSIKSGDSLNDVFNYRLPELYSKLLQAEYDYQLSEENIKEQLYAREFLESGKEYY